jgi:predicted nuclease of predicted toxin-antitoxin system
VSNLKFLVDANLGVAIVDAIRQTGHDVVFVGDLDWSMPDDRILAIAKREERIILTMDTDFGELIYQSRQPHAGVLLLRMPGSGADEKVRAVVEILTRYGDRLANHFVVYRAGRLRIRG